MEYFVPRSVSDFNLPTLSETNLSTATSTILPPDGSTEPPPPPPQPVRMCNTTPRHHKIPPQEVNRVAGVGGREKMVTFEDERKLSAVEDVFM